MNARLAAALAAAAVVSGAATVAQADTNGARWLRERGGIEWMTAAGGWRTSLGSDLRAPGAEALGGGTEVIIGIDVWGALGVVLDGRFLGGLTRGEKYLEGMGGLALQLHVSDTVRMRFGAAGGELVSGNQTGVLAGGFIAASFDLFAIGGRVSIALSARIDVDAILDAPPTLPDSSLALAVGLGVRY